MTNPAWQVQSCPIGVWLTRAWFPSSAPSIRNMHHPLDIRCGHGARACQAAWPPGAEILLACWVREVSSVHDLYGQWGEPVTSQIPTGLGTPKAKYRWPSDWRPLYQRPGKIRCLEHSIAYFPMQCKVLSGMEEDSSQLFLVLSLEFSLKLIFIQLFCVSLSYSSYLLFPGVSAFLCQLYSQSLLKILCSLKLYDGLWRCVMQPNTKEIPVCRPLSHLTTALTSSFVSGTLCTQPASLQSVLQGDFSRSQSNYVTLLKILQWSPVTCKTKL
jgi:hypothetical protein